MLLDVRGWCCGAEVPVADRLALLDYCPQTQLLVRFARCVGSAPPSSIPGSTGNVLYITNLPRTASSLLLCSLVHHQCCVLGPVCSKCIAVVWGKAVTLLGTQLSPRSSCQLLPRRSRSPGLDLISSLFHSVGHKSCCRCKDGSSDPRVLQHLGPGTRACFPMSSPTASRPDTAPQDFCQTGGPSANAATFSMGSACRIHILPPRMRMEAESVS